MQTKQNKSISPPPSHLAPRSRSPRFGHRRAIERLSAIHQWIRSGSYPNAQSMALKLAVTVRTVLRDIDFMKKERHLPIAYHPTRYGYYYSAPVDCPFPQEPISEAGLFAILVAHKAVAQYHGTPFEKPLRVAFQKLTGQLDQRRLHSIANLGSALSFRPFAPEDGDLRVFKIITRALETRRVLAFKYRNAGQATVLDRRIRPYHLTCFDNRWYLVGWDLARAGLRTFVISRLTEPVCTRQRFPKPTRRDFDSETYLAGSFGVMKGDDETRYEIVIEFDAFGRDLIRGRRWHASQKLIELACGGARLSMVLSGLEEIERAVLSWGTHATVIRPIALAQRIGQITSQLSRRYAQYQWQPLLAAA